MRLETERLILRRFVDGDAAAYFELNADPDVMRYYPAPLTRAESDGSLKRIQAQHERDGFCFLAAEVKATGAFIGLLGMARLNDEMRSAIPGAPDVEIGWRLRRDTWGHGLAPEGAQACLRHAWDALALQEVVAFSYEGNGPSRRVMEKIGMRHDPEGSFGHTKLPPGHPLRPHVLYRIANPPKRP